MQYELFRTFGNSQPHFMLTLFASPKAFVDSHIATIQRNAIRSWIRLEPRPRVILFGNEIGTAEICKEFSLTHIPEVEVNEFGTPLLNDIVRKAEACSSSSADLLCYVNADIILMSDFSRAVELVAARKSRFLMGARPWNLDVTQELSFDDGWEEMISAQVAADGQLRSERSCDFFVFPRGLWGDLPPFAVGRAYFDNALLHRVRRMGGALVDATPAVVSIHQNHSYPRHLGGAAMLDNAEAIRNVALAGGPGRRLTWKSSTYLVSDEGLRFNTLGFLRFFGPWSRTSKLLHQFIDVAKPVKRILGFSRS
jgi:hypothetical protein